MKTAVIGASGYSGEELVKLLLGHPHVELAAVTSRTLVGQPLAQAMPALSHLAGDLCFTASDPSALAARDDIDLFFLALPHGVASDFAQPLYQAGKTVIDLSADFGSARNNSTKNTTAKSTPHPNYCGQLPM